MKYHNHQGGRDHPEGRENGVALISVVIVLLALVIIATPFSISMRNYSESSTDFLHRTRAAKECEALRNLAMEKLKETHHFYDTETPYSDTPAELEVDMENIPFDFNTSDPLGKIWRVKSSDLQGRINLNGVSIYLIANLLGQRTTLNEAMEEGAGLNVVTTDNFPDSGFIWVDGEAIFYSSITEDSFSDLDLEQTLLSMETNPHLNHSSGSVVVSYTAYLIATYCYKWNEGRISSFSTVESVRNISTYGEQALQRSKLDDIESLVTVNSGYPSGRRFVNSQRVLKFGEGDLNEILVVENGRYIGPGSIVRIRCDEDVHYSLVLKSRNSGNNSWTLLLQDPVPFTAEVHDQGIVDVLSRPAVNINTASTEVLEALLTGLCINNEGKKWIDSLNNDELPVEEEKSQNPIVDLISGVAEEAIENLDVNIFDSPAGGRRIRSKEAKAIATAIKQAPINSFAELTERLGAQLEQENPIIDDKQRWAILLNAMNSNDAFVEGGTAPFCFTSEGCFQIDTAVSDNYPESGREMARQFMRDTAWVAPSSQVLQMFSSQVDFEEQRRLNREGRRYLTLPKSLDRPSDGNYPPSLAPVYIIDKTAPSEDLDTGSFQLAPTRAEGVRAIHFDRTDTPLYNAGILSLIPSKDNDLSPVVDYSLGFRTGERVIYADTLNAPLAIQDGAYARIFPFSVEFWYRFTDLNGEHYIFDCGIEGREENNRIYLFHDGKELIFRVSDCTIPTSTMNTKDPIEHCEIRYDFSDLPLETGVFYHIACMVGGTKPSDIALFIDGVPRGKRSFYTRLTEPLTSVSSQTQGPIAMTRKRAPIQVEDSSSFPERGVLRIGSEVLEYVSHLDDEFAADSLADDPFGGRGTRGTIAGNHFETEGVELYGYTSRLQSDLIPQGEVELGNEVGPFWVAMININDSTYDPAPIMVKPENQVLKPTAIGEGLFTETVTDSIPVCDIDGTPLSDVSNSVFSPSGGYAVMFTEFPGDFTVTFKGELGKKEEENFRVRQGDSLRPFSGDPKKDFLINGFSVFRYTSFSGSSLFGIEWGCNDGYPNGDPAALFEASSGTKGKNPGVGNAPDNIDFLSKRCFVTKYISGLFQSDPPLEEARVFIFPISLKVNSSSANLYEEFYSSVQRETEGAGGAGAQRRSRPEIVQIDLDFTGDGENETEWVKYNSIENDMFIRDDPDNIADVWNLLSARNYINYAEDVDTEDTTMAVNNRLKFRGRHGTTNGSHAGGAPVLPVFRVNSSAISRPGRHDNITLVNPDPETEPEAATINYCNCYPSRGGPPYSDLDYGGNVALIGLRRGVLGEYLRLDFDLSGVRKGIQTGEITAEQLSMAFSIESRDYTRICKFPSGELPSKIPETMVIGGNILGFPSQGEGCIDEMVFKSFQTPNPPADDSAADDSSLLEMTKGMVAGRPDLLTTSRFVLWEELEDNEDDELKLFNTALYYNRGFLQHQLLEDFEILKSLPQDAGLLLIGNEIIAYTDVDTEDGIITIAPEGRGVFGTEPQFHAAREPVQLLNFPTLSILEYAMSDRSSEVCVQDADGFPFEGAVLIDQEVIGYTRLEDKIMLMPEEMINSTRSEGLLRGRYGTEINKHESGSVVFHLPARFLDLYMPAQDTPESAYFPLSISAPGAFYSRLSWVQEKQGSGVDLVVQARVGGRGAFSMKPSESKDIFLFDHPGDSKTTNYICRQGDRLDLRVYTRYNRNAFDSLDFVSNAWKYSPKLKALGVEYVQPTRIIRHEEWR